MHVQYVCRKSCVESMVHTYINIIRMYIYINVRIPHNVCTYINVFNKYSVIHCMHKITDKTTGGLNAIK